MLEGTDGAGTTTQLGCVAECLRALGIQVYETSEPSGGPAGALIRMHLASRHGALGTRRSSDALSAELALLFAADRVHHVRSEVSPALERGAWVISDRYVMSSLVYQGAELPEAWVAQINGYAPLPDVTLFLDVSSRTAANRRSARGTPGERYDAESLQRRVIARYRKLAVRDRRVVVIDGEQSTAVVTEAILAAIHKRLGHPKSR